jgi:hypothetical protein
MHKWTLSHVQQDLMDQPQELQQKLQAAQLVVQEISAFQPQ